MAVSPYFTSPGVDPSGAPIARLLMQRNELNQDAVSNLAQVGSKVGSGIVGAIQGAQNPSTFGAKTSGFAGLLKGFAQNVDPQDNGGMNTAQLTQAGKSADAFRAMIKAGQAQIKVDGEDQSAPVFGIDDEKWNNMSSLDKFNVVSGAVKGQAYNAAMANIFYRMANAGRANSQATLNNTRTQNIIDQAPLDQKVKQSEIDKNNAQATAAQATAATIPAVKKAQIDEMNARIGQLNAQAAKDSKGQPAYRLTSRFDSSGNATMPAVEATTSEGFKQGQRAAQDWMDQNNAVAWPGAKDAKAGNWYQTNKGLLYFDGSKLYAQKPGQ